MSDKLLVSIITVVCNGQRTLERTIQSVIAQTYDNIEYIIIDGGSSDGTIDIIKKYEDKITYWVSEPDNGISDAFNKGIKRCKGELIGILHSDDWYELKIIERVVNVYNHNLDVGVIHGDMRYYKGHRPLFVCCPSPNQKNLWVDMIYNHPACFVAKSCYDKFGVFDMNLKIAMDHELMLKFYVQGVKFYYIPEVLANMKLEGASDKRAIQGFYEVMLNGIKYGCPKYKAWFWFLFKIPVYLVVTFFKKVLGYDNFLLKIYYKFLLKIKKFTW